MNYLLFCIFTILCINPTTIAGKTQSGVGLEESEELGSAQLRYLGTDYSNGFHGVLTFFDSIRTTIIDLTAKINGLHDEVARLNVETKNIAATLTNKISVLENTARVNTRNINETAARIHYLKRDVNGFKLIMTSDIADLTKQFVNLENSTNSNTHNINNALRAIMGMGHLERTSFGNETKSSIAVLTAKTTALQTVANSNSQNNKRTKALLLFLENRLTETEIVDFVKTNTENVTIGKSFNGLALSTIKSLVSNVGSGGNYTVVVFVNHLDEAIENFTIFDLQNTTFNPAPNSIPPHTKEVFTFAEHEQHSCSIYCSVRVAFSYDIPHTNVRIATRSAFIHGANSLNLDFVPKDTEMRSYYYDRFAPRISGDTRSFVDSRKGHYQSVGYKKHQAVLFAQFEGDHKANLRIELFQLPQDG